MEVKILKNTIKGMKSVFGDSPKTAYIYARELERVLNRKYKVLLVDGVDGIGAMPFAREGQLIDCYEPDGRYFLGGMIEGFKFKGLKEKLDYENLKDNVSLINKNFYEERTSKKYDLVYVYRSIHKKNNSNLQMKKKMNRLLMSVKENGYIYILYYLAINEKDYINYPKNQYVRKNEIKNYFDDNWEIINIREENILNPHKKHPFNNCNHSHKVGYLFAKKKSSKNDYKYIYHYKLNQF